MKNVLVTGSLAYDHLMTFDGNLKDSLIDKSDALSVSFTTNSHHIGFGGCAGNIAYSLKKLGENPIIFAIAGNDFDQYRKWLEKNELSTGEIVVDEENPSACANILTDLHQNQFTMFSPGAMQSYKEDLVLSDTEDLELAIIGPELSFRMIYFANYFKSLNVPYIFDPGQAIPILNKDDFLYLLENSIGMILNDYELEMVLKKLNISIEELVSKTGFIIKTLGENGADIYAEAKTEHVEALKNLDIVDSTGCGDAFRAGFIHGYINGKTLVESSKIGCKVAAASIEKKGTQNHEIT